MTDAELIESLGGATRVAELLGYDKDGGVQRVHNWITRGIPPKVKLEHQDLFLRQEAKAARKPSERSTASITQREIDPYVCGATARPGAKCAGDRPSKNREGR